MSDELIAMLIVYMATTLLVAITFGYWALVGSQSWETEDQIEAKKMARAALLSPVWPLLLLWGLWIILRYIPSVARATRHVLRIALDRSSK